MATKNFVPRATGEGQLGTTSKKWNKQIALTGSFGQVTSSLSSASTGSYGIVDVDVEVTTPMMTFQSHTTNNQNFNIKSGSISISITDDFTVGSNNTITIEESGRLLLVPPSFFTSTG